MKCRSILLLICLFLSVTAQTITKVVVSQGASALVVENTKPFWARCYDNNGVLTLCTLIWHTNNSNSAAISINGVAFGVSPGNTSIWTSVSSGVRSPNVPVTMYAAPTPTPGPAPTPTPTPTPTPANVSYPQAIANLSLNSAKTVYYRLSETSGTSIADSSGGSHTGTKSGAITLNQATLLTGDSNPSALFAGGNVHSTNFMPALTTGLSMSCLVSFTSANAGNNQLMYLGTDDRTGRFSIDLITPGANTFVYTFYTTTGAPQSFNFPTLAEGTPGRIYHLAVTHDFVAKRVNLYQDGILVSTQTYSVNVRALSSQPVRVGNDTINATIDEALVAADKVLTDDDVYNLFRASRAVNPSATTIYVGPSGNYRATGTNADPIDLYTAIRSGYAKPGQSYNLKAGDYTTTPALSFPVIAHGTSGAHLTIQNNPGENARILQPYNASSSNYAMQLKSLAQYVDIKGNLFADATNGLQGLEITNIGLERYSPGLATGIAPSETNGRGFSLVTWDANTSTMNNVLLHDGGLGIDVSQASTGSSFTGDIAWHNGTNNGGTNITGMALYVQNQSDTTPLVTRNGIFFRNFNFNFQGYGKTGPVKNIRVIDTIMSDSGAPARGAVVAGSPGGPNSPYFGANNLLIGAQQNVGTGNIVDTCETYHPAGINGAGLNLGYIGIDNHNYQALNNFIWGSSYGIAFSTSQTGTATGNTIFNRASGDGIHQAMTIEPVSGFPLSGFTLNNNQYYIANASLASASLFAGGSTYSFANWKATRGYDVTGSTFTTSPPVGVFVRVHPSPIVAGMASISVFNPGLATTAKINLSTAGLVNGQQFQIVNVQGASSSGRAGTIALTGTYNSSSPTVTLPMNDSSVVQPISDRVGTVPVKTSLPEFGIFLVVPIR